MPRRPARPLPPSDVRRDDFARIVAHIEASEPNEMERRRLGVNIARRLAALPSAVAR